MAMVTFAAVLTPMRTSVGAGLFAISVVGNISYFSFGLLAPLSGHLADRVGSRAVFTIGLAGMAVSCVVVALASNIYVLAAGLGALGLSAAVYHPAGLSLIARRVVATEKAMAYHGIFGSVGLALGPVAAGAVTALAGWRWAYAALAVALVALTAALALFGRGGAGAPTHKADAVPLPTRTVLPALLLYYAVAVLIGFIYNGATTFLPTYLGKMRGLFLGNVATTVTLLAGIAGQYIGGRVGAKGRHEFVMAGSMLTCAAALGLLGALSGPALVAPAVLFGVAYFATQPVTNTLISRLTSAPRQGMAYGVNFFLTFGVGSLGTSFTGYIGERFQLGDAFLLLGAGAAVAALFSVALWFMRRQPGGRGAPATPEGGTAT